MAALLVVGLSVPGHVADNELLQYHAKSVYLCRRNIVGRAHSALIDFIR